jgi:glutathione reductase (NADPH)
MTWREAVTKTYDLVIIGTGTAAQVTSARVRAAGWKVAVIDHRPFGGTCALRGCDPKKMLISGAEAIDAAYRMRGKGVTGELRIDWRELMAFGHHAYSVGTIVNSPIRTHHFGTNTR